MDIKHSPNKDQDAYLSGTFARLADSMGLDRRLVDAMLMTLSCIRSAVYDASDDPKTRTTIFTNGVHALALISEGHLSLEQWVRVAEAMFDASEAVLLLADDEELNDALGEGGNK